MMRMPASWQRATASATSGRGGSNRATRPSKTRSCSASSRSSGAACPSGRSRRATASTRSPSRRSARPVRAPRRAARVVERLLGAVGAEDRHRTLEHGLGSALRVDDERACPRRRRSTSAAARDRSGRCARRCRSRRATVTFAPSSSAACSSPTSVASPRDLPDWCRSMSAVVQAASVYESSASTGSAATAAAGSPSVSRSTSPAAVRIADRPHPVLGQRSGLVGADHGRRAQGLDGAQALDERSPAGQARDADGKREGDGRQESLRDVGHDQADRERRRVLEWKAGERATRAAGRPRRRRRPPPRSATPPGAPGPRSGSAPGGRPQTGPRSGRAPSHAGREDERPGLPADARRAAEDETRRVDDRAAGVSSASADR